MPQYAWVMVNGKLVGEHGGDNSLVTGMAFRDFVLDEWLNGSDTEIEIFLFGDAPADTLEHFRLITYPRKEKLEDWAFRPWREPAITGEPWLGAPTWWSCEFSRPDLPGPLFLVTAGLSKGQAYLNGRALGRYWEIGPQHSLYLPKPWFQEQNRLGIFDEEGKSADRVYLLCDGRVPALMIVV
jgi:hypothetical protein